MTADDKLISAAKEAAESAYAPYSGFRVGAALRSEAGIIYMGCNVENASYGASNCAERTAFFSAVTSDERKFSAIAIYADSDKMPFPCGICRQVMAEFCGADFKVIVSSRTGSETFKLGDLLPHSFEL